MSRRPIPRSPAGSAIVITGASSGIGRATAHALAREGAQLVLAARRADVLDTVVAECTALGARALAVPTDVTVAAEVDALAARCVSTFGGIDAWINNAAVLHMGRIDATPEPVLERVIQTNVGGYLRGARAAIRQFRQQHRGTLVCVGSAEGYVAQPFASAYVASKFAIAGLCESLREELLDEGGIHVCLVVPSAIDTPIYQRCANYSGLAVEPLRPRYDARDVARTIVELLRTPRPVAWVGGAGPLLAVSHAMAPASVEAGVRLGVERLQFGDTPAQPTPGNLFEPVRDGWQVDGGWRDAWQPSLADPAPLLDLLAAMAQRVARLPRRP